MYGYIYMIINKVNGKTYIGQRKSNKFCHQDNYMGSGKLLLKAYKKYGIESFEKLLVQYVETKEEADKQEIFWIAHYREKGMAQYNIADGGHGDNGNSHRVGWHHSEETKRKISNSHIGIFRGREPWNKGKKCKSLSEEHKRKICESVKNKLNSEETKRKMSEAQKKRWTIRKQNN